LRWIEENRTRYVNQWVAVEGGRLIAVHTDTLEVFATAKAEGIETPFVVHVVAEDPLPFTGMVRMPVSLEFDVSHLCRPDGGIDVPTTLRVGTNQLS
jgi:hypothetical protein